MTVQPSPRLLLIEDDLGAASSLKRLLAAEGYSVETAQDGTTGLALAQAGNHDVILTDWRLPGATGIEIIQSLHRSHPRLPIILITAHGSTEITRNIASVSQAATSTSQGDGNTLAAAAELAKLASSLRHVVESANLR